MVRKEEIEKKADEISGRYGNSKVLPTEEECIVYNTAIEMAKWADKTMIEKACKWLKDDMLNQNAFQGRLERLEIIDGIIERFKIAMEE